MLKNFNELYKLDIKADTIEREMPSGKKYTYLPWEACLRLLYENGAEAVSWPCVWNFTGYPGFFNPEGKNPFVRISLNIDGKTYPYDYPVIDGEHIKTDPNQLDFHVAVQRAFVKAVAIHTGLGLKLWEKEASEVAVPISEQAVTAEGLGLKVTLEFGKRVQEFGTAEKLHEALGTTKASLAALISTGTAADKEIMLSRILAIKPKTDVF